MEVHVMGRFSSLLIAIMLLVMPAAVGAQDRPLKIKSKSGTTKVVDKSKSVRRELEALYAKRAQAVRDKDWPTLRALVTDDYTVVLPDGQTMQPEQAIAYLQRGLEQFVSVINLTFTLETINLNGNEAQVDARQNFIRTQKLRDGKVHTVTSGVIQRETWSKTPTGWKHRLTDNIREQRVTVDGVPVDPNKPYNPGGRQQQ
ncbi:MAG: hypothetical protein DMF64_18650 [Acidobacteria bacterium]|nr:MAG: hypothetical protein DMF64_18650 [Acidobacteriota bacterium]